MRSDTVMGASGCILKKKEDINIDQLIDDIRIAADRAGSPIIANKKVFAKDDGRFRYMTFNIFDKEKKDNVLLYLFNISEFDSDEEFDWIIPGGKLIHIINIEDFVSNERSMLDFIYEYLCINKNDIFWDESDWFYDLDPIKMIKNKEFDSEWCYKPVISDDIKGAVGESREGLKGADKEG